MPWDMQALYPEELEEIDAYLGGEEREPAAGDATPAAGRDPFAKPPPELGALN